MATARSADDMIKELLEIQGAEVDPQLMRKMREKVNEFMVQVYNLGREEGFAAGAVQKAAEQD